MRKLALDEEILMQIEKPARYIGNEVNSVMKDKKKIAIRFAIWESRFSMTCLTAGRTSGASGYIPLGQTWTGL